MYERDFVDISKAIHAQAIRLPKVECVSISVFHVRNPVISLPNSPITIALVLYCLGGSSKHIIDSCNSTRWTILQKRCPPEPYKLLILPSIISVQLPKRLHVIWSVGF